jgi:hypothetical protein
VAEGVVAELEERGGSQIGAAGGTGRWVLPWVGGWQRLWTNSPDASACGGPATNSFGNFVELSARQFVYGPGPGGAVVEYLFASPSTGQKYLLSRAAGVTNLGDRFFELDFAAPLQAYDVLAAGKISASRACFEIDPDDPGCFYSGLKSQTPVQVSGAPTAPAAPRLTMRTTYLSENLWIVRNEHPSFRGGGGGDKITVYQRSGAQSVMDRRGLVLDNQLNPSNDEATRYGKLLFSDSDDEYGLKGWQEKTQSETATKDKLLGR